jgi:hypothetical protein
VINISGLDDEKYHVNKSAAIPWEGIELDIKKHFLPRGCKLFQGSCCGIAVFVGPDCIVSKFKLAEHKKKARIRSLKNRGDRKRAMPQAMMPAAQPQGLTDQEKIQLQEAGSDDQDSIADKRNRRLGAQQQRLILTIVFSLLTVILTAGVVVAMWWAVESSKPPPPPPVSKPSWGTVSPWAPIGKGTTKPGGLYTLDQQVVAKNNSAMLYWNEPSSTGGTDITGYTVYYSENNGEFKQYTAEDVLGSPYRVLNLKNNAEYTFKLIAKNKMGYSDQSGTSNTVVPHDVVRQALYDIYTQTGGATSWHPNYRTAGNGFISWTEIVANNAMNPQADVCKFRGVVCESGQFPVIALELSGEGAGVMKGALPGVIGNLVELQTLNLFGNRLTGAIPVGIGSLRELRTLQLSSNSFSGKVPDELQACTKLNNLNWNSNSLTIMTNKLDSVLRRAAGNGQNCKVEGNPWVCPIPDIARDNCAQYPPVTCKTS